MESITARMEAQRDPESITARMEAQRDPESITARLAALADPEYAAFTAKLIPTIPPATIIGVRTPALRALAADLTRTQPAVAAAFMADLPHATFDENQLHALLISLIPDMPACLAAIDAFLPHVDNWATCDQILPRLFARHPDRLLPAIDCWLAAPGIWPRRFGIRMLMRHFLDDGFRPEFPARVAGIVSDRPGVSPAPGSDEYYLNMMVAWYFAEALARRWDDVIRYLQERRLPAWTHNRAIQKACESYRVPAARKAYLRSLKVKSAKAAMAAKG